MRLIFLLSFLLLLSYSSKSQQIINIDPDEAEQGTTLGVTISGQNTNFLQASQTVFFNQGSSTIFPNFFYPGDNTTIQSQFSISYSDPLGYYDVNVYNPTDGLLTKTNGFLIKADPNQPHIVYADPDSAKQGQTLSVTITGQKHKFLCAGYRNSLVYAGNKHNNKTNYC
jgi:hypothetical protein